MTFSILSDVLGGLRGRDGGRRVGPPERHYYTPARQFEQSLDIYRPTVDADAAASAPVVALVVGSAWLGHRPLVYLGTSWWNSAGPRTVAELGNVCICIRHRGSFPKTWSLLTLSVVLAVAALVPALLNAVASQRGWDWLEDVAGETLFAGRAGGFLLAAVTGLLLVELGGIGAATYDEMQRDVVDALAWCQAHEGRLRLARGLPASESKRLFIFGGYSSGGHVAATVSQTPRLWEERGLDLPHVHCDAMLYISAVLATRYDDDAVPRAGAAASPATSPGTPSGGSPSPTPAPPTWLVDQIVRAVFGGAAAATLPSPLHACARSPAVPHAFLGCEREAFGLTWLDAFFAGPACCAALTARGVASRCAAVRSDHWSILNSHELSFALRRELEWIERECRKSRR